MKIIKDTDYPYLTGIMTKNKKMAVNVFIASILLFFIGLIFYPLMFIFAIVALGISGKYYQESSKAKYGIEGEKTVTNALRDLDDSYYLVNDVKLHPGAGNIDHILLSPKGVYAIETKNWSGNIRCYGDQWSKKVGNRLYDVKSVSKQAKRSAIDVNKFIREKNQMNLYVSPICVFTNPSAKLNLYNQSLPVLQVYELSQYIQNIKPTNTISESDILKISHSLSEDFTRPTIAVQKTDAKIIAESPVKTLTNSDSFKKSGDEFFKQEKFNDAIQCYKKAIEINPDFIPAWNNLGFAYFKIGQLENAKKCKERIKVLKNSRV